MKSLARRDYHIYGYSRFYSFDLSCNIHTGAEVFNYPWDAWSRLTADDNWWTHIASHYADTAHSILHRIF